MPNAANKNAGPHHQCRQQAAGDGRALDQRCGLHGSLADQLQSDAPAGPEGTCTPPVPRSSRGRSPGMKYGVRGFITALVLPRSGFLVLTVVDNAMLDRENAVVFYCGSAVESLLFRKPILAQTS